MKIQPISHQPSFSGKLVIEKSANSPISKIITDDKLASKFKEIETLMREKSYNLYLFKNKQHSDFYNVAANKTLKKAKSIKEYTVKIQSGIMLDSLVDAAKDAINMYEKYISKGIKG